MRRIVVLLAIFVCGCYKNGLYVQQEWVDREFLASVQVGTPDPKKDCLPTGERLLVGWQLPLAWIYQEATLNLTVRFWDNEEELICYPVESSHGSKAFNFFGKRILTYRVDVVDACGNCLTEWEHQFWTKLIDVDKRRSSVSCQPMQASVIETP